MRGHREPQPGDPLRRPVGADAGEQPLGPLLHALRGPGLGRLGAHLVRLRLQRGGLPLGVHPLPAAAPGVGLALLQVGLPAEVVDVQHAAVGVEVEDLVDHGVEQLGVVADHHQAAAEGPQVVAQPADRVRVQVVGRLVQQQRVRAAEQDPGQLDPPPLAARQRAQRLLQHLLRQPEARRQRRRLGLGRVSAEHGQPLLQVAVPAHAGVAPGRVRVGHPQLGLAHPGQQRVQAAGGQDPVHRQRLEVTDPRVLRQVADRAADCDLPGRGLALARQHPGQRGLAGAVAADEADLVARGDLERGTLQQQPRASAQLNITCGNHAETRSITGSDRIGRRQTSSPGCGAWRHDRSGCMLRSLPEPANRFRGTGGGAPHSPVLPSSVSRMRSACPACRAVS